MSRKINLDDLRKVESSTVIPLARRASDVVQAIIKVKKAGHVPKGVQVRAKIGPHMFTGEFKHSKLASLEKDAEVESVAISKKLKSAK